MPERAWLQGVGVPRVCDYRLVLAAQKVLAGGVQVVVEASADWLMLTP